MATPPPPPPPNYTMLSPAAQAFKNTGNEQTLSGLPLTADQLFFVTWAQVIYHKSSLTNSLLGLHP